MEAETKPAPAPVTMEEARDLVNQAIDLEREADTADREHDAARERADQARQVAQGLNAQSAKAWALARVALRCVARRLPLPENIGRIDFQTAPDMVIPDDAKPGDIVRNVTTGQRYQVRGTPDGALYAFPIKG